jgi:phosphoglucosamine mutase
LPRRYFGTDGVRGVVGEDLTEALVERLARAFALTGAGRVLVAMDTRASGPALASAVSAGLVSGGSDVIHGGVLPTPAVPLLRGDHSYDSGVVVSASHNPPQFNGVKFFRGGFKLDDHEEEALEARLDDAPAATTGAASRDDSLAEAYVKLVCDRFGGPLQGLRLGVDSANGAMTGIGPSAFEQLGASVVTIGNEPDGTNINVGCGATDLSALAALVRERDLDLGVAFDGDGDRMLAVDAAGNEVDGDEIVAILALHLGIGVVAVTQMTNLGFHRLMAEKGIRVLTTAVGDRYVLEALRREGAVLGGEQSGHILYLREHTSGDGLVAAILLARAVVETGRDLAALARQMTRFPQAKANVQVSRMAFTARLEAEIERANGELGADGRLLVRPSGTEPVVRVLVEAEREAEAYRLCGRIEHLVGEELG